MTNTKRVKDSVEIALSEEFLTADKPSAIAHQLQEPELEECFTGVGLDDFDLLIADTVNKYERYDTAMDAYMAVDLHKSLPITRRQASDMRFWAWLGVVHEPDFVAWRWKPSGEAMRRNRERFYGDRVRQTYTRLWWAAELTRENDDYMLTQKLLGLTGFQDNYEAMFGRAFCNYRPALEAFISVAEGNSEKFIRNFAIELGYALTTSVLETMDTNQIQNLMETIVQQMKAKAG